MTSRPKKRSLALSGHRTSLSLENEFWLALQDIAKKESTSLAGLVDRIDRRRGAGNLSSAIRVFVLDYFRAAAAANEKR